MPLVTMPDGVVVDMPDNPDPALLAELEQLQAGAAPVNTTDLRVTAPDGTVSLNPNYVPPAAGAATVPGAKDFNDGGVSTWDEVMNDLKALGGDALTTLIGAPELAASVLTDMGSKAVAGLTAPFVGSDDQAADYVRNFTAENTYQPRTESGRTLQEGLGTALEPFGNIKQALGETTLGLTDSPLAATLADVAPDVALTLAGGRSGVPGAAKAPVRDATGLTGDALGEALAGGKVPDLPENTPVTRARRAGYDVLPSDAERIGVKVPGKTREKLLPTDARRDVTIKHQENTNRLAREELGLPEGTRLDEKGFAQAKQPHFDVYKQAESVAKRGPISDKFAALLEKGAAEAKFKTTDKKGITEVISGLRSRARRFGESQDVATQDYAEGLLDLADEIEGAFGEHLKAVGEPKMLKAYQEARQSLAKINDVEQAERGGQINADIIRKRGDKGSKLSGRLKIIAETAEHFPDTTKSSLSSAGRAAVKEPSAYSMAKDAITGLVRKIPGLGDTLDVLSEGFQNKLGRKATPEEESYFAEYGRYPDMAAPEPVPQITRQGDMLGSAFEFESPEGAVGVSPSGARREAFATSPDQPMLDLQGPLTLTAPRGRVGRAPSQRPEVVNDIGDVLIDGEPLAEPITDLSALNLGDVLAQLAKKPRK